MLLASRLRIDWSIDSPLLEPRVVDETLACPADNLETLLDELLLPGGCMSQSQIEVESARHPNHSRARYAASENLDSRST
jgi:hypothetical protein